MPWSGWPGARWVIELGRVTSEHAHPDIDRLRAAHPLWNIGAVWTSAASGPDSRRLTATREGIQVHAWTAAELSAKITAEEAANDW
jgi:hypothetical protein